MDLKAIVADHLGLFSPYDLPGMVVSIAMGGLLGAVTTRWGARQPAHTAAHALWGALAALGFVLVKGSLPLAITLVAVVLLVRPVHAAPAPTVGRALAAALLLGACCGAGASLIAAVAALPVLVLLRWAAAAEPRHG